MIFPIKEERACDLITHLLTKYIHSTYTTNMVTIPHHTLVLYRVQKTSGSGTLNWTTFGFGFIRVSLLAITSGSGFGSSGSIGFSGLKNRGKNRNFSKIPQNLLAKTYSKILLSNWYMVKKQTNEIKQAKYFRFTSLYEKKLSQLANFTKNNWLSGTLGFELRVRVYRVLENS